MIAIIGAGPGGSYAAYLLAKAGKQVAVFEEHPDIGIPVACTGLLIQGFEEHLRMSEDFLIRRINKARIYSPDGNFVEVRMKDNYLVERHKFDKHIAKLAVKEGAEYYLNHRFTGLENGKAIIYDKENKKEIKIEYEALIGADGPLSSVAKAANLFGKRQFYFGSQVHAEIENDDVIEFYPQGTDILWLVPDSKKVAKVGVAAKTDTYKVFTNFAEKRIGKNFEKRVIARQAAPIPLFKPDVKVQKENIYLVGDAATTVKATTLGGINQSIIGAKALADSIINKKNYQKEIRKKLWKDLWIALQMRKVMNKFSDKDYNNLIELFQNEKLKKILNEVERDYPQKYVMKMFLAEPRLLTFMRFLV